MKFFFSQPIAFTLALATMMVGCSYKSKTGDVTPADQATFLTNKQSASQQLPDVFDDQNSIWRDFPNKRMMTFRTCIQDAMLPGASVAFEKFVVLNEAREEIAALTPTDQSGCFEWTEPVAFNYLANEHYMYVDRTIAARGHYRGEVNVTMMVNPWSAKAIDARYGITNLEPGMLIVPSRQESKALFNTFLPGNLKLDGITANLELYNSTIVNGKIETKIQFNLSVSSIRYYRKGLQGEPIFSKINSGAFDIKLYLFEGKIDEQNNKNVIAHSLLGKASVTDVAYNNEKAVLNAIAYMTLTRAPGSNSTLYFGIRVEPSKKSNPPKGLGFDQNVAILGGYALNKGPISASPSNITYLNNIPDLSALEKMKFSEESEFNAPWPLGFYIDALSMSTPGQMYETNIDSPQRSYNVPFSFCLRDTLSRGPVQQLPVYYQVAPQGEQDVTEWIGPVDMNSSGCSRSTNFPVKYNLYDTNKYIPYLLRVKVGEAPFKNIIRENPFYFNPWGGFGTFFVDDQKYSGPKSVVPNPLPFNNPELVLEDISATFIGNKIKTSLADGTLTGGSGFELNKFMQMKITKGFQFNFKPKVKFYYSPNGDQSGFVPFVNGRVNVEAYVLVRRDARELIDPRDINLKDYRLVSIAKRDNVVVDRGNTPNAALDFKLNFTDMPQAGLRSLIVVKIKPSKEFETLNGMAYASFFDLTSSGGSNQVWRASWNEKYTDKRLAAVSLPALEKDLNALAAEKKLADDKLENPMSATKLAKLGIAPGEEARAFFVERVKTTLRLQNNCQGEVNMSSRDCNVDVKSETEKTFSKKYVNLEKFSPTWFDELFKTEIVNGNTYGKVFELQKELCNLVIDPLNGPAYINDCRNNIAKYMDVTSTRHIVKMNSAPKFVHGVGKSFSIGESRGFNVGRSMSFSKSVGTSLNASLGLKLPVDDIPVISALGPGLGASASLSRSVSEGTSQGDSYGYGASVSRGASLDVLLLGFNATVRKCVLVKPLRFKPLENVVGRQGAGTNLTNPTTAYHICSSNLSTENLVETWYFVGVSESPERGTVDGFTLDQNTLVQIFRGERMFNQFLNFIQSKNVSFTISQYADLMNMNLEQVNQRYTDQVSSLGETIEIPRTMFMDSNFPGSLDLCTLSSPLDVPSYCRKVDRLPSDQYSK